MLLGAFRRHMLAQEMCKARAVPVDKLNDLDKVFHAYHIAVSFIGGHVTACARDHAARNSAKVSALNLGLWTHRQPCMQHASAPMQAKSYRLRSDFVL